MDETNISPNIKATSLDSPIDSPIDSAAEAVVTASGVEMPTLTDGVTASMNGVTALTNGVTASMNGVTAPMNGVTASAVPVGASDLSSTLGPIGSVIPEAYNLPGAKDLEPNGRSTDGFIAGSIPQVPNAEEAISAWNPLRRAAVLGTTDSADTERETSLSGAPQPIASPTSWPAPSEPTQSQPTQSQPEQSQPLQSQQAKWAPPSTQEVVGLTEAGRPEQPNSPQPEHPLPPAASTSFSPPTFAPPTFEQPAYGAAASSADTSESPISAHIDAAGVANGAVNAAPGNGAVNAAPGNGAVNAAPGNGAANGAPGNGAANGAAGNGVVYGAPGNGAAIGAPGNGAVNAAPGNGAANAPKASWAKPAMVGGLVGALMASAVLGTALVATRRSNNKASASSTLTPIERAIDPKKAVDAKPSDVPPAASGAINVPGIVKKLDPSVVAINIKGIPTDGIFGTEVPEGAGSGIVLSKDGYILTNAHVIANASSIKVAVPGQKSYDADIVGRDTSNDIAVVKIRNVDNLVPATLGASKDLVVGESVVAIGNALALPGSPTVTSGIISALNRNLDGDGEQLTGVIQTDTAINPGNSGGPLVNSRGEVIGMNTAIYKGSNNIGFAIAMDRIQPVVEGIRNGDFAKPRTFLGVTTQTMTKEIKDTYGLGADTGAIVVEVTVGSPAENAGLVRGDIITKFDGQTIKDNKQLGELVRKHKAGDAIDMTYMRGLNSTDTKVTLGSALRENG